MQYDTIITIASWNALTLDIIENCELVGTENIVHGYTWHENNNLSKRQNFSLAKFICNHTKTKSYVLTVKSEVKNKNGCGIYK